MKESRRSAEWIEPRIVEDRRTAQTYGLLPDELLDPFAAALDQVHVWRRVRGIDMITPPGGDALRKQGPPYP